jgi:putative selenium metabolism hydrolase
LFNAERKDKITEICQELIKAESTSGKEEKAVKIAKRYMEDFAFDEIIIDKYGSLIGRIKGSSPGKKILLDGHLDTVAADQKSWSRDPFQAEIKDDKIYGRGSSDMKGALAAMLAAASFFAEDNEFKGEIYLSFTVFEELFEGAAARKISELVKPDYVIIGEASALKIMRGQRGRAEIVVETAGRSSHSSSPEVGHNAVYDMVELIKEIQKLEINEDQFLGKGIMELTDIKSEPYPGASVIPNKCRATYDRRLLTGESKKEVLQPIKEVIKKLNLNAEAYLAHSEAECWTGNIIEAEKFFPAWTLDSEAPLLQKAVKGLTEAGIEAQISHYSFCTNGSHYAGERKIPTIGFGPSLETLAHVDDEYIELDHLYKGAAGYYYMIKELLK